MKNLQKLIIPGLIIAAAVIIYFTYFQKSGLGSFEDFDTNNNANKDIIVKVVQEKGFNDDPANNTVTFYAIDAKGMEVLVQAPMPLPGTFTTLDKIKVKGHRHTDHFHAVEVVIM